MNTRKPSPRIVRVVLLFVVTVICGEPIFGQAAARPNRGTMPTGSYSVSDIENISLTNGNVNIGIPLASLPPIAGGKLGLSLRAEYNSKQWDTVRIERQTDPLDPGTKHVVSNLQMSDAGGWRLGAGYSITFHSIAEDYDFMDPSANDPEYNLLTQNRWSKVVLTTPDGAKHELRPLDYATYSDGFLQHNYLRGYYKEDPINSGSMRYYSFDGSYLWARIDPQPVSMYGSAQSWTLYLPDGTKVEQLNGVQRITDTNGNKVKIFVTEDSPGVFTQNYQDEQTGREIKISYDPSGNGGQGLNQVQYQTVGGTWVAIVINYGTTRVFGKRYEFGDQQCPQAANPIDTQITVIRSIVLPQTEPGQAGRQFTFTYNSDTTDTVNYQWSPDCFGGSQTVTSASHGWGSLSRIVMPTGAIVNYGYSLDGEHYLLFSPDDAPRESMNVKTLTHDGTTDSWTYFNTPASGGFTASDGSFVTEARYSSDPGFAHTNSGFGGKEELVYRTNNSNKVMVERHWTLMRFTGGENIAPGAAVLVAFNPVIDAEYTSLLDDSPNHNPVKMSAKTFQYDFNGNVIQTTEYDWFDPGLVSRDAQGVPTSVPGSATVLRVTNSSYHNPATTSSSGNVYAKRSLSGATPRILNALRETITGPATTQLSYDGQAYGSPPTAGNLTSQSVWDDVDNKWITSSQTYGPYGNLDTKTDPRGKITRFFFDDATHALPTRVVVDPQNGTGTQTSSTTYDFSTGLVTSQTDPNLKTTNINYTNQLLLNAIDPFGRPGIVTKPLGQQTKTLYEDSARSVTVMSDLNSAGDGLLKSQVLSDQLGRTTESRQFETATSFIAVRKTYDTANRISKTSNPFRAGETIQWTTTVSDTLGRVVSITTPDNAVVGTVYSSNTVTVTDQAGKARRSVSDALGRLIQVYEDPSGLNYLTSYDYDVFGNLLHVYQGSQTRTFTYDSLSRLRTASNPESGTISYTYDDNGNLTQKTDARGVVSTFTYDSLNRNTQIDYSDATPDVFRQYDQATNGKGRLNQAWQGGAITSATYMDSYDAMGRPLVQRQLFETGGVWSSPYQTERTYNLAGGVTTQKYPSLRTVTYNYDNAGRLADKDAQNLAFTGNLGDGAVRTYSKGISYSPFGGIKIEQFGTDTPLYHKLQYNVRGQLWDIRVATGADVNGSWNRGCLQFFYDQTYSYGGSGPDNNGNVLASNHYRPLDESSSSWTLSTDYYSYDALNRITSVSEYYQATGQANAQQFQQSYTYDRWGNRTIHQTNTWGTGIPKPNFGVDPANNNRLTVPAGFTMSYDQAGNVTNDTYTGQGERTYDAENRMLQAWANGQWQVYTYNADGQRVRRKVDGTETWQIYGMDGELLAEYPQNGSHLSPQKEYGYRNGQLLVELTAAAGGSWGSPPAFSTPNPLVAGQTEVKASHITELRAAIDALRSHHNLGPFPWQHSATTNDWISANPILEMRTALDVPLGGLPPGGYSAGLAQGELIKAIHIQELRDRVVTSWNSGSSLQINWLVADHLGTPRIIVDKTGALANVKRHDYLPFGEELFAGMGARTAALGYSGDNVRQKFTSKERDNETGLDYFGARYYGSTQGRFTSPDPFFFQQEMLIDPQRFNLYSYVRNNPLVYIDPTGMVIDISHLSKEEREKWERVLKVINAKDENGNYINLKLREVYTRLDSDQRTFYIENHSFGERTSSTGQFNITKHNGKDDFSEAEIWIDFERVEHLPSSMEADFVPGFKKYEGLIGKTPELRAELFGHEGAHGVFALDNVADAVHLQIAIADRDAAMAKSKRPFPPDVLQKMEDVNQRLIPTEKFAQQTQQIINKELRSYLKNKK